MTIELSPKAIRRSYWLLGVISAFLILITALSDLGVPGAQRLRFQQFDLKLEANFATWYSSFLLLLASAGALAVGTKPSPSQAHSIRVRWTWYAASGVFLGMSIDETAMLHEQAGYYFTQWFGRVPGLTDGVGLAVFGWLILAVPLVILFASGMIFAARNWLAQNPRSFTLAIAGVICWIGVIVAEFIEAQLRRASMNRSIQGAIEEGLELAGSILFLISFLEFLQATSKTRMPAVKVAGPPVVIAERSRLKSTPEPPASGRGG